MKSAPPLLEHLNCQYFYYELHQPFFIADCTEEATAALHVGRYGCNSKDTKLNSRFSTSFDTTQGPSPGDHKALKYA
jgi:hypothetical protein